MKVELDLSNYGTKSNLNNAAGVYNQNSLKDFI